MIDRQPLEIFVHEYIDLYDKVFMQLTKQYDISFDDREEPLRNHIHSMY